MECKRILSTSDEIKNRSHLSELLGITPQRFSLIENGNAFPTLENILILCQKYGGRSSFIIDGARYRPAMIKKNLSDIEKQITHLAKSIKKQK